MRHRDRQLVLIDVRPAEFAVLKRLALVAGDGPVPRFDQIARRDRRTDQLADVPGLDRRTGVALDEPATLRVRDPGAAGWADVDVVVFWRAGVLAGV